jgi:hypothetical protein
MRPHNFPCLPFSESRDNLSHKRTHGMINKMSGTTHGNPLVVIGLWEQIECYIEGLLTEKNRLLDPEYYDSWWTNNATLIKSKKYFWVIEFLIEARTNFLDNINQAKHFVKPMSSNPPSGEISRRGFVPRLKKHNTAIQKLESLRKGFVKKQGEAKVFRDGVRGLSRARLCC